MSPKPSATEGIKYGDSLRVAGETVFWADFDKKGPKQEFLGS